MEDLFRQFWWLLFPLGWFVVSGVQQLMRYRRQRDTIDLLKVYAANGREPPPELIATLNNPRSDEEDDWDGSSSSGATSGWFYVVLFGFLGAGFGYAAFTDLYGAGEAFTLVALVFAALAAAYLVSSLLSRRKPRGR